MHVFLLASILATLAIGCTKKNPNLCCTDEAACNTLGISISPCDEGLLCRGNQCIAQACSTSSGCDESAPFCGGETCVESCNSDGQCPGFGGDPDSRFCVVGTCDECRVGMNDCPSATPICDAGTCRGCALDDECASTVCDVDAGACVDANAIRYADPIGTEFAACTHVAPCTLARAASLADSAHPWVRLLPGQYLDALGATTSFSLVGTGATIKSLSVGRNTVKVRGLTADTFICNNAAATLVLRDVLGLVGGSVSNCQFSAKRFVSRTYFQLAYDVIADIDQSKFEGLHFLTSASSRQVVSIKNSVIHHLDLTGLAPAAMSTRIDIAYSTVFNPDDADGAVACGVDAATPIGISFVNNIFASVLGTNAMVNNGTRCVFEKNLAFPQATSVGTGTIIMDPRFVDPLNDDLHLLAGSPAIDTAVTTPVEPSLDFDGTLRPQGGGRDVGAFEFH